MLTLDGLTRLPLKTRKTLNYILMSTDKKQPIEQAESGNLVKPVLAAGVPKIHYLKTINPYYSQVWDLNKKFEFRKNDRDFQVGDIVHLQEYYPLNKYFSGSEIKVKITSLLKDFEGIEKDYCIFSFTVIERIIMNVDLEGEVSHA